MKCNICNNEANFFSNNTVLNKYDIDYFKCSTCGFVQTEEPYWLEEAYSSAVLNSDVGMVARNIRLRLIVKAIIEFCFESDENVCFLDYGGGYGLLSRMMRDLGFNFYWYDKYCEGIFVSDFFVADMRKKYFLSTAFELFEHFSTPLDEVESIFKCSDNIVFSTMLLPQPSPKPDQWWYYGLDGGQHISFYTPTSLSYIAKQFNKFYVGIGDIHIFSDFKIPKWKLYFCIKFAGIISCFYRRNSLIPNDYEKITGVKI